MTLPSSRTRSGPQGFVGGMVRREVSARTVGALRELARRAHTTLFSAMLTGFCATLWHYTRQDDLVIGSAFANRQLAETEDVIGMFVNAVVLRCDAGGDPTFAELLRRTGQTVRAAGAHQEYPFVELVRSLNPDRDPTTNPYFRVMFSANDALMPDLELPGCSATVYERDNGSAKVDLSVVVIPRAEAEPGADGRVDGRVSLLWEYNSELIPGELVGEVADAYLRLLAVMTETPDAPVGDADAMGPRVRADLLAAGTGPRAGRAARFADLFSESLARTPDAPAISTAARSMSYAEVADGARAVAELLDAGGAQGHAPVALLLRRTPRALVALLGTLLSGRGYLPLDPAHPADRLAFMLADAGVRRVLVDADTERLLPPGDWKPLDVTVLPAGSTTAFRSPHPEATAWVMYTSGSTGRPKGCRVTHANLDHLVRWSLADGSAHPSVRALASSALTFDVSVHEIVPVLAAGGSVVLVDDVFGLRSLPRGWCRPGSTGRRACSVNCCATAGFRRACRWWR
ncbi:AMP-binding protein [Streptacidiphilus sp. 4-A2]|nr:AMP-binding protein [Streptacidiphilus sp. 4-A2]